MGKLQTEKEIACKYLSSILEKLKEERQSILCLIDQEMEKLPQDQAQIKDLTVLKEISKTDTALLINLHALLCKI